MIHFTMNGEFQDISFSNQTRSLIIIRINLRLLASVFFALSVHFHSYVKAKFLDYCTSRQNISDSAGTRTDACCYFDYHNGKKGLKRIQLPDVKL